jgi:hypothetical protein
VPISVFLGILAVPLAAAASMFLVSPSIEEPAALAEAPVAAEAAVASAPDLAQDLLVACGPIASEMIELERAESLTELQSAALDALRPICSQEGLPLPEDAGSQTVQAIVTSSGPVANGPSAAGSDDDWGDDDSDDDHDWDDDDDSDDDHDWDEDDESDDDDDSDD